MARDAAKLARAAGDVWQADTNLSALRKRRAMDLADEAAGYAKKAAETMDRAMAAAGTG